MSNSFYLKLRSHRWEVFALLAVFLAGAWLRFDRLATTTGFAGDQGEYYLAVMRWIKLGEWPLVGQRRSGTDGDHTLHPGFIYNIAPALAVSNSHPAAGAAIQIVYILAGYLAAWAWLRRGAKTAWPSLLAICVPLLAPNNIVESRSLWNPRFLLFGLPVLLCCMSWGARRPALALTCIAILLLWMPAWHTTAYVIIGIGVPFWLYQFQKWRPQLADTARRTKWICAGIVGATFCFLYLPPILYELQPGPGNFLQYLHYTFLPNPPSAQPLWRRIWFLLNMNDYIYISHFYGMKARDVDFARWGLSLSWLALVLGMLWRVRRGLRSDPTPLFLFALMAGYYFVHVRMGEYFHAYFLTGGLLAPVLLAGWSVNTAQALRADNQIQRNAWCGVLLLATILFVPAAAKWADDPGLPQSLPAQLPRSEAIAEYIKQDSGGMAFSLALLEPINWRDYLHALLWRIGARPTNDEFPRAEIRAPEFGQRLYIVIRGAACEYPLMLSGVAREALHPHEIGADMILTLNRSDLPSMFREIRSECDFANRRNMLEVIP